jgi:DNA-binding HxlR family transcriptional regulator
MDQNQLFAYQKILSYFWRVQLTQRAFILQVGTGKYVSYFEVTIMKNQQVSMAKSLEKYSMVDECPIRNVLDRFGDKWSILIIIILGENGTLRFSELHKTIGNVSQKMLTVTLRTLEADGLIARKTYPEVPPRVEYTLTDIGYSLLPHIQNLADWAHANLPAIAQSRKKSKE